MKEGEKMLIEDYTLNKKFSELETGTCFVMYSEYYMKLYIKYYDDHSNNSISQIPEKGRGKKQEIRQKLTRNY